MVGSLNVDTIVTVDRHPLPGETLLGSSLQTLRGGKGGNQAIAAARANASATSQVSVAFVGRVGDDAAGRGYIEHLASAGVDVSGLRCTPGEHTGSAIVIVNEAGENSIVVSSGANALLGSAVGDLVSLDSLERDDVVALSMEVPLAVVVQAAALTTAVGARLVLNLSPVAEVPEEVVRAADPVIVNEGEAAQLAERFPELPSVLVTRGAAGSEWNGVHVAALQNLRIVDTTGAGDAYCGTLALRLAVGDDALAAMSAATAAAGEVVGRAGAQ
ncbi:PfkB family carbohydrate kinase [Pseudoclavibacter terrae]|uniref:PfkB family carbohydrate kinase n=1 Tax=Pseudoclavibacter terrae TaxID=1530195 RepID=UPI00232D5B52|nr:PfkB family carbohydrate kinase [Pseudoclavibacter terrae]